MGTVPPDSISSADFAIFNTRFAEEAAADGLTGNNLDWGTAYLIADAKDTQSDNSAFISEKIGEYSYKKASHTDEGIGHWMQKYLNLVNDKVSFAPSSTAIRKDADMSKINIDQNPLIKFYGD